MAQPISCDVCHGEQAVIIMTMLDGSESPAVGAVCLPAFLGAAALSVMDAGQHRGLPQRCQACRRMHERMTLAAAADRAAMAGEPANVRDQPGPGHDQAAAGPGDDGGQLQDQPFGGAAEAGG